MHSQTLRVALIVALGALLALLILRPWQSSDEPPVPPVARAPGPVAQAPVLPAPAQTFRLPKVAPAVPVAKAKEPPAKRAPPGPVLVPKDWLLRGSAPQNYDLRSERAEVFANQMSVVMIAHDKDVARSQFASLMQTAVAAPWLGKRIEFAVNVKAARFQNWEVWVRATDSSNVVIAYDEWGVAASKLEWRRGAAVIDVPWSAAAIAYGVNFHGSGKMYVDDTHLNVLDKGLPAPLHNLPAKLGVVVQDESQDGPLPMPSNLDFEDAAPADPTFRERPKDRLDRSRF
jgi:hypothetical protein